MEKFTCPYCNAISGQLWGSLLANGDVSKIPNVSPMTAGWLRSTSQWKNIINEDGNWIISCCENCRRICIWRNEQLIHPDIIVVDEPNEDLPKDIKNDYLEAASILNKSPRGAAALLRLAVQKLCIHLGEKGDDLNHDIGELVRKGLPVGIEKALDSVRIIGNNAVHPGEINLKDNPEIATKLFSIINFITEKMITEPKELESFYDKTIPDSKKEQIKRRDKKQ
mgnify:CR=1 FL=1